MNSFAKVKEALKAFYGRFDFAIDTLIRFVIAFAAMKLMSDKLGYSELLNNKFIILMVSLVCSIIPWGLSTVALALGLLMHIYKASMEVAIITAFILMVIALLYYGFQPGHSELMVLTPILFALKLPYLIVFLAGLSSGFLSVVPISVGILVCFLVRFVNANVGFEIGDAELTEIPGKIVKVVDAMVANKQMWKMIALFVIVLIIIFIIHNFSFDYSRYFAIAVGAICLFAGGKILDAELDTAGIIISMLIAAAYNFVVFSVDYKNSDRLEFEDDEYVYYVKAIPKISTEYFKKSMKSAGKQKTNVKKAAEKAISEKKITEKKMTERKPAAATPAEKKSAVNRIDAEKE